MNRERFLIVHGTDGTRWAERYSIEPLSAPCIYCGASLKTTLPFACGSLRGLVAERCDCGNENTPYCLVRGAGAGDLFTGTEVRGPTVQAARQSAGQVVTLLLPLRK